MLTANVGHGQAVAEWGNASASAARASYPNLVAAIAIAIAESAASGQWPRPGPAP